jgi:hypothetical protein
MIVIGGSHALRTRAILYIVSESSTISAAALQKGRRFTIL